ncbi:hypothetical protein ACJ73_05123 [Blastomyces percursus]|uniref:Zn(2)-C6 fungal-type domain-containing protein n=1 Tax=Blastomyces percursus TaxID=1658174 RepID=A0A1J9Q602_9EURO|nr:hypothetical protein ACJ73_05123 [Blastomyces percursus]
MEMATGDKSKARVSASQAGHRLPAPPLGHYEHGWRPYSTYDGPNQEHHGETPRAPPVYMPSARTDSHGPPEMSYGRPGGISAPPPQAPTESHPPPGSYRPMNGSQEQTQHPQAPPQQAGPSNFQPPRMGYPPDARHPNGETHGVPMYSHGDPMQPIPASQPYTPGGHVPPTLGLYETSSYFLAQAGMPIANRQRRTTRAQQACDQCRSRKAKCDEGRPACSHCKENNVPCVYKDVPPQKQERSTQIIIERIDRQEESEKAAREDLMTRLNEMKALLAGVKSQMDVMAGSTRSRKQSHMTSLAKVEANANFIAANLKSPENQAPAERVREEDGDGIRISEDYKNKLHDPDAGELSIPIEHTTAAHKLLLWPSIQKLLPERIDADYVMLLEENRGPLRLYGIGEGDDTFAESPVAPPIILEQDPTIASLARANVWGSGFGFPPGFDTNRWSMRPHPGGLTPYGTLNLEAKTIQTYYQSYLDNMHALHPFLDASALHQMIYNFVNNYSPRKPTFTSFSPQIPQTHNERAAAIPKGKRKRSAEVAFEVAPESIPENTGALSTVIHKSLDNAVVLLVLALGSICDVKTDIPGPLNRGNNAQSPLQYQQMTSTSPTLSDSGKLSAFLPPNEEFFPSSTGHDRRFSAAAHSADTWNSTDQSDPPLRNLDIIPGLAYFALASDILGDVLGGGGLKHTQACLLAALYTGQLARPFSSHAWICEASRACQILLRRRTFDRIPTGTRQKELIHFAFWTCLQLESDILAELDLPASGISRFEDRFYTEAGLFISTNELQTPDPLTMIYYVAQIHLRKVLNRVHTELYKAESPESRGRKLSWSAKVQEALSCNLEAWRTGLPDNMRWEETDPPSDNIIIARMRGKYYGARYIIHRPLLHHALHPMGKAFPGAANSVPSPNPSTVSSSQSQASQSSANPAHLSHGMERLTSDMGPPSRPVVHSESQHLSIKTLDSKVRKACQACIDAAIQSTIAFDGVAGRPVVTNIFGTAHAQFGNMLVLSATYMSPLSQLVDREILRTLLNRTINFLLRSRHISPTLSKDAEILTLIRRKIFDTPTTSFSSAEGT